MFELLDFDRLTKKQVVELIRLCQGKLEDFKQRRGARIWQHRELSEGYISGTIRYEVLKRARFRCELCGISAELKALEVDHIVPRNRRDRRPEQFPGALLFLQCHEVGPRRHGLPQNHRVLSASRGWLCRFARWPRSE
jgi:5-methylcytosine-specific restriction endonuclease McrA